MAVADLAKAGRSWAATGIALYDHGPSLLPVILSLRLTNRGLVDVAKFDFVSLFKEDQ